MRTPELVDQIEIFLNEDRRSSLRAIVTYFEMGETTVHCVVHEDLNMHKVCQSLTSLHKGGGGERGDHDDEEEREEERRGRKGVGGVGGEGGGREEAPATSGCSRS